MIDQNRQPSSSGLPLKRRGCLGRSFGSAASARANPAKRPFSLLPGEANRGGRAAARPLVFAVSQVLGLQNRAFEGGYLPHEAPSRHVGGAELRLMQDLSTGELTVARAPRDQILV